MKQINYNHKRERDMFEKIWNVETPNSGIEKSPPESQVRNKTKDMCLDYLTLAKQDLISGEGVICFDIWFVVTLQQPFSFRKLDFAMWNSIWSISVRFDHIFHIRTTCTLLLRDSFLPVPQYFLSFQCSAPGHQTLSLSVVLSFYLFSVVHACQDITSLKKEEKENHSSTASDLC